MESERRDEGTEPVGRDTAADALADPNASGAVPTTEQQTVTLATDPYAAGRDRASRIQKGIYLLFGIVEGLLGIRFVMGVLGAGQGAALSKFISDITGPLVGPFEGLFGTSHFGGNVMEWNALAAIVVYALIGWVLAKVVDLVMGDSRHGVYTTTSRLP